MCFDVSIHQPTRDAYDAFCKALVDLARHHVIVAGYNQEPWFTSEITFYYEPMSTTLQRLSPGTLTVIGGYRDTTVLLLSKPDAPPTKPYDPAASVAAAPPSLARRVARKVKRMITGG
jgi:hypothetical protein